MSDTASSSKKYSANDVVATYDGPDEARAAMTMLERHGVDGSAIELFGPGVEQAHRPITNDEMRHSDMDMATTVGKRFTAVSFVVAVAGAGLGALLGYLIANDGVGLFMGALGGFIVGGLLGFLYGGYTNLPTNPELADTFIEGASGPVSLAVHVPDEEHVESTVQALKGTDARRLAVAGPDGQLRDVA